MQHLRHQAWTHRQLLHVGQQSNKIGTRPIGGQLDVHGSDVRRKGLKTFGEASLGELADGAGGFHVNGGSQVNCLEHAR